MDKIRIHEMLECMTKWCLSELEKGKEQVCIEEMGKAIDMVKDLAEAEKAVWEKCYFKAIAEEMEEEEKERKEMGMSRAGYDRWRTSSGRFAPKGTGHETSMAVATGRRGYTPEDDKLPNPYYDDPRMWPFQPWYQAMGYDRDGRTGDGRGESRSDGRSSQSTGSTGRMGYTPDDRRNDGRMSEDQRSQYYNARRGFHESGSQEDRMKMDSEAEKYLMESIDTMRDIFAQADPKMQQKMKNDIAGLFREMGGK